LSDLEQQSPENSLLKFYDVQEDTSLLECKIYHVRIDPKKKNSDILFVGTIEGLGLVSNLPLMLVTETLTATLAATRSQM
jgi:hypothetical protein